MICAHLLSFFVPPLLCVPRDLDQLDPPEAAHAKSGNDAKVLQLQGLVLLADAGMGNFEKNNTTITFLREIVIPSHVPPLRQVHVSGLDVGHVGDEVVEGLPVDDEAGDAVHVVRDDVGRALLLAEVNGRSNDSNSKFSWRYSIVISPLQRLLAEEVSLVQVPNELLLFLAVLTLRDLDLHTRFKKSKTECPIFLNIQVYLTTTKLVQQPQYLFKYIWMALGR